MKKIVATILTVALLLTCVSSAFAKATYDPEKLCFVIVAIDEETRETYVTEVSYKTTMKRINAGLVYEVYLLEADSLVRLEMVETDGEWTLVNLNTEEIVTVD